jgi:hypothetical protein
MTNEEKKSNHQVLVRLDEETFKALKALSFYSDVPIRAIVSRALKAYGLEKRVLEAKKEAGVE